jgi:uncharacterized damage-inducible protein DinB
MHTDDFLRMFSYDEWANGECLRAMRESKTLPASTLGRLAHILSAERLWLERLRQQKQTMPVWPTSTIEECQVLADEMGAGWRNYLNGLGPEELDRTIEYCNTKGELWSNRIEDVLMHVIMHSAYHRGQIAMEMRAAGVVPAYTDYIHAVRQGMSESQKTEVRMQK